MVRNLALAMLLFASPAMAEDRDPPRPPASPASPASPARLLNHLPYGESDRASLMPAPAFPGCKLRREMIDDLDRMVAAAQGEGIELAAVSCFRSIEHQRRIFCSGTQSCDAQAADRARFVGPPGHSEHATGYAIDFTQRGADCPATEQCFALTPAGRWLMTRAAEFGFELSFPAGNKQGVGWEPWHWRWVGRTGDTREEARLARARFEVAQSNFPAFPAVQREEPAPPAPPPPPEWLGIAALHSVQLASIR